MNNHLEHITEDHHFEIRQKIQAALIVDFYRPDSDPKNVSNEVVRNEEAYSWLKTNASIFDSAFNNVIEEYPSFFDDADKDFAGAVDLVKQKFIEEENRRVGR